MSKRPDHGFVDENAEYAASDREYPGIATYHKHVSQETVPQGMWFQYYSNWVDEWVAKRGERPGQDGWGTHRRREQSLGHALSIYRPIRQEYEIRVLEIHPGNPGDPLVGTLHHCSIEFRYEIRIRPHALLADSRNTPIWYTALSYTWGPPIFEATLLCQGIEKRITRSLETALRQFRRQDEPIVMWIDQICINQDDTTEKVRQIRLMSDIYHHAYSTIIWIGPPGKDTHDAIELIQEISFKWYELPEASYLTATGLPAPESAAWEGIYDILGRPWFSRLWTIQECVLSVKPWIMCGEHVLNFEDLGGFCEKLKDTTAGTVLADLYNPKSGSAVTLPLWHAPVTLMSQRYSCNRGTTRSDPVDRPSLVSASNNARHAQAFDLRDKIYGMLGMLDPNLARKITVSYDEAYTPGMAFCDATITSMLAENPVVLGDVLCSVDHEPHSKLLDLPSWVPDWSRPRVSKSLASGTSIWHIYNASKVDYSKPRKSNHVARPETRELLLQACIFNAIESLSETCTAPSLDIDESAPRNEELAAWADVAVGSATSEVYDGRLFEAFWRTLVADKNGDGNIAPNSFAEIFSLLLGGNHRQEPVAGWADLLGPPAKACRPRQA